MDNLHELLARDNVKGRSIAALFMAQYRQSLQADVTAAPCAR